MQQRFTRRSTLVNLVQNLGFFLGRLSTYLFVHQIVLDLRPSVHEQGCYLDLNLSMRSCIISLTAENFGFEVNMQVGGAIASWSCYMLDADPW
jgi:hypothetical protein